jgi:hypothetical protein
MQIFGTVAQDAANMVKQVRADAISKDVNDAKMRRDLDNDQFNRFDKISSQWDRDTAPFKQVQSAFNSVKDIAALPTHDPKTDQYLARLAGTVLNPGVAVRPGEDPGDQYFGAFDHLIPGLGAAVKFAATGASGFTDDERANVLKAVTMRADQENQAQTARNTAALNAGKAANLPDGYLDQLTVAPMDLGPLASLLKPTGGKVSTITGGGAPTTDPGATGGDTQGPPPPATTDAGPSPTSKRIASGVAGVVDTLAGVGEELGKPVGDAIRKANNQPASADTYKDATGAIYRKVDRGGGRFEWQLYRAAPANATPARDTDEHQVQVSSADTGGF